MPYVVIKEEAVGHHSTMTFDHLQVVIGKRVVNLARLTERLTNST